MTSYALYRLPGRPHAVRLVCRSAQVLRDLAEADGAEGYLIHPFQTAPGTPAVLLHPDSISPLPLSAAPAMPTCASLSAPEDGRDAYRTAFRQAQTALHSGECRKVVLARTEYVPLDGRTADPESLFFRACRLYPQCFVALFSTPQTGTWLTASPEVLLEREGSDWHTAALAGTIGSGAEDVPAEAWSGKNRREQELVAEYLRERLSALGLTVTCGLPRTRCVGPVAHLQTDITAPALPHIPVSQLLRSLHPTPAINGLPTEAATRLILAAEGSPRRYYAGFSGPLRLLGETRFYVTLRCMELHPGRAAIHVGGGLLPESVEEDEWTETCRKADAVRRILPPAATPSTL